MMLRSVPATIRRWKGDEKAVAPNKFYYDDFKNMFTNVQTYAGACFQKYLFLIVLKNVFNFPKQNTTQIEKDAETPSIV